MAFDILLVCTQPHDKQEYIDTSNQHSYIKYKCTYNNYKTHMYVVYMFKLYMHGLVISFNIQHTHVHNKFFNVSIQLKLLYFISSFYGANMFTDRICLYWALSPSCRNFLIDCIRFFISCDSMYSSKPGLSRNLSVGMSNDLCKFLSSLNLSIIFLSCFSYTAS